MSESENSDGGGSGSSPGTTARLLSDDFKDSDNPAPRVASVDIHRLHLNRPDRHAATDQRVQAAIRELETSKTGPGGLSSALRTRIRGRSAERAGEDDDHHHGGGYGWRHTHTSEAAAVPGPTSSSGRGIVVDGKGGRARERDRQMRGVEDDNSPSSAPSTTPSIKHVVLSEPEDVSGRSPSSMSDADELRHQHFLALRRMHYNVQHKVSSRPHVLRARSEGSDDEDDSDDMESARSGLGQALRRMSECHEDARVERHVTVGDAIVGSGPNMGDRYPAAAVGDGSGRDDQEHARFVSERKGHYDMRAAMAEARRLMAEDENEEENEMDADMGGGGTDTNMDDGGDDSFMNGSARNGDRRNGSVP